MITRDNYEPYFLDFAEGRLPAALADELQGFLVLNPDLADELSMLSDGLPALPPPAAAAVDKSALRRGVADLPLADAHLDELLCALAEGDYPAGRRGELEAWIAQSPERERQARLHRAARLEPRAMAYPAPSELHRLPDFAADTIARHNAEAFAIASAEGVLPADARRRWENWLTRQTDAARARLDYSAVKLAADTAERYPNKAALKRGRRRALTIALRMTTAAAAAAAVMIIAVKTQPAANQALIANAADSAAKIATQTTRQPQPAIAAAPAATAGQPTVGTDAARNGQRGDIGAQKPANTGTRGAASRKTAARRGDIERKTGKQPENIIRSESIATIATEPYQFDPADTHARLRGSYIPDVYVYPAADASLDELIAQRTSEITRNRKGTLMRLVAKTADRLFANNRFMKCDIQYDQEDNLELVALRTPIFTIEKKTK